MYHPDTNKATEEKFKTINMAYQILGNEQKVTGRLTQRKDYDNNRSFTGAERPQRPERGAYSSGQYTYTYNPYNSTFHYGSKTSQREYQHKASRSNDTYNPYSESRSR